MLTAIVGINWGDEGKGRMVDLLSEKQDIVVRYQGGNNAGHTVINGLGKFVLNLLPSGILREDVVNVMGNGMVIDIEHLSGEIKRLTDKGVKVSPDNLKISDKAVVCMPYHVLLDCLEEDRLKDNRFGSTRRGIAPVYSDKYMKKAIRMGDLLNRKALFERLEGIVEWKNLTVCGAYGAKAVSFDKIKEWICTFSEGLIPYICDVGAYLAEAAAADKKILFEAQLGALRDIDFGIYPYTSSSSTIAAYAPIGAGIPRFKLDETIGIMKAYSTCVGEGPFTVELSGSEAEALRSAGDEYGAATGRPRRVGPFDAVASRYGIEVQGADCTALTKLDILSDLDEIKICTHYDISGKLTKRFPTGFDLDIAKPVYETVSGWRCDISQCRRKEDLPEEALYYIKRIEQLTSCPVKYVSVGAEREAYIKMY